MTLYTIAKHEKLNNLHCYDSIKVYATRGASMVKITLNGESLLMTLIDFEKFMRQLESFWESNRPAINEDDYNERIDLFNSYWNCLTSERGEAGVLPLAVILWGMILVTLSVILNHIFGGNVLEKILEFLGGVL